MLRFMKRAVLAWQAKYSQVFTISHMRQRGQAVHTPVRYDALAAEGYGKNVVAFQAVNRIAEAVASIKICLFDVSVDKGEEIEDHRHPLLLLLAKPQPRCSGRAFMRNLAAYHKIAGNAYIEAIGPGDPTKPYIPAPNKLPTELWLHRPDRIKIIPGEMGVKAYVYDVEGQRKTWEVDEIDGTSAICHLRTFHPLNDLYGMSPIEAAVYQIDQNNAGSEWNYQLVKNSASPSGAIETDKTLSDAQYDRIKKDININHSGSKNPGKTMVLDNGLKWNAMGFSPKEMDWIEGQNNTARNIALTFGCPPILLNIPGDSTYANLAEAYVALYRDTVIPLLHEILDELNTWLVPLFGDNLELRMDLDEVPALESVRRGKWDAVVKADWLTINEKREATGYDKLDVPEADEVLIPSGLLPLGTDPAQDPNAILDANGNPVVDPAASDQPGAAGTSGPNDNANPDEKPGKPSDKKPPVDGPPKSIRDKQWMLKTLVEDGMLLTDARRLVLDQLGD